MPAQGTATTTGNVAHDLAKAESLCNALLVMTAVPWSLCCAAFTGLYWTYPRDKAQVRAGMHAQAALWVSALHSLQGGLHGLQIALCIDMRLSCHCSLMPLPGPCPHRAGSTFCCRQLLWAARLLQAGTARPPSCKQAGSGMRVEASMCSRHAGSTIVDQRPGRA